MISVEIEIADEKTIILNVDRIQGNVEDFVIEAMALIRQIYFYLGECTEVTQKVFRFVMNMLADLPFHEERDIIAAVEDVFNMLEQVGE